MYLRSHLRMKSLCLLLLFAVNLVKAQEREINPNTLDSSVLPVEHRGGNNIGPLLGGGNPVQQPPQNDGSEAWPLAQPDMPAIKNLQVQCEKNFMRVQVEFDRPFSGLIFSKGFYSTPDCVHVQSGSGTVSAQFDIFLNSCGMTSSSNSGNSGQPSPAGTFIENIIIIQYDPLVQEMWDAARKLRCTWFDYYEKSVTFRPFQVDMLNAVTANFLGDNLQCWMQIQVGKGPWASEVSGIVKIGQTMTMVLAIKDDENKFDMMVRNCVAHDGTRAPIQLVDERGCVTRPKIMGKFQKAKNFGESASVVSYAYFQAFKFPDSMNVHFQCVIQVCKFNCPEPQCGGPGIAGPQVGGPSQPPALSYEAVGSELSPQRLRIPQNVDPRNTARNDNIAKNLVAPEAIPVPFPVDLAPAKLSAPYLDINRVGDALPSVPDVVGRPRSLDLSKIIEEEEQAGEDNRAKRSIHKRAAQEKTDVSTSRVIQVVAPGDVAFNLNSANETVVVSELIDDASKFCMSTTGFTVVLIMLLSVLIIACIVAGFMYTRIRAYNAKSNVNTFVTGYEAPEFVKIAGQK